MNSSYYEKNIVVGPFQCNCRLIVCPQTGQALVVDPGDEAQKIIQAVETAKTATGLPIRVKYLLQTHGHLDHIGATREVKQAIVRSSGAGVGKQQPELANAGHPPAGDPPKIALHRGDEPLYVQLKLQGQFFGINYDDPLPIDHYLEDGELLSVGKLRFSILHTPGHSPGSIGLRLHEDSGLKVPETLYSGDTLFQGSVGRTDLWGADQDQMFSSIRNRILTLDDDTRVCPGHGPETRIGIEKRENPFLT